MTANAWRRLRSGGVGSQPPRLVTLTSQLAIAIAPGESYTPLKRVRELYPNELTQMELCYAAGQRSYDVQVRTFVMQSMELMLSEILTAHNPEGENERIDAFASRIQEEVRIAERHLRDDGAMAATRGLNIGLILGLSLTPITIFVILFIGENADLLNCTDNTALFNLAVCIGGGAIGASLSVVVRIRNGYQVMQQMEQHSEGDKAGRGIPPIPRVLAQVMRREGFYRVTLGWLLAASVFFLVGGGIITVIVPPAGTSVCSATAAEDDMLTVLWLFWGGLGFLAGLNERWAYGLLQKE